MKSLKLYWYNLASKPPKTFFGWIIFLFLLALSFIYRFGIALRNFVYRIGLIKRVKLSCRVISVGNITVGGTGKTPMVEYLAKEFVKRGKKVVILSRGYGRIDDVKDDEEITASDKSVIRPDEPFGRVRLTGANRAKLGQFACKEHLPDIIILDDGFQHLRLARDTDIVMIDCLNPFGNYDLLPAGILREKLKALKRAGIFIITHSDLCSDKQLSAVYNYLIKFGVPVIKSVHKPVALVGVSDSKKEISAESVKDKKAWVFCGIGNPDSFIVTLAKMGVSLRGVTIFPDHYMYKESDINGLISQSREAKADCIITTMKDMTKVKPLFSNSPVPVYALKIELEIKEPNLPAVSEPNLMDIIEGKG